jgi:hypothetical protein
MENQEINIDNPCIVCNENEAIDSGMCKKCYGEAVDYLDHN